MVRVVSQLFGIVLNSPPMQRIGAVLWITWFKRLLGMCSINAQTTFLLELDVQGHQVVILSIPTQGFRSGRRTGRGGRPTADVRRRLRPPERAWPVVSRLASCIH